MFIVGKIELVLWGLPSSCVGAQPVMIETVAIVRWLVCISVGNSVVTSHWDYNTLMPKLFKDPMANYRWEQKHPIRQHVTVWSSLVKKLKSINAWVQVWILTMAKRLTFKGRCMNVLTLMYFRVQFCLHRLRCTVDNHMAEQMVCLSLEEPLAIELEHFHPVLKHALSLHTSKHSM